MLRYSPPAKISGKDKKKSRDGKNLKAVEGVDYGRAEGGMVLFSSNGAVIGCAVAMEPRPWCTIISAYVATMIILGTNR